MSTPINEVPWMIEGGAKHTVQVARNLSYMASGGKEGIVRGKHLEVRELAAPGPQVRVFPGTVAIQNRAAGASDEMYVLRIGSEQTVDVPATDGAGGRSDLLVARVENPWAAGETWPDPADPTVGPYASLALISNVPASTTSAADLGLSADHSMIALARIDIPASTATITQGMIVDLRTMSNALTQRSIKVINPDGSQILDSATFENWPGSANMQVDAPEWATHCMTRAILAGIVVGNTGAGPWNAVGSLRMTVGDTVTTQSTAYNIQVDSGSDRFTLMCGSEFTPIPVADRGRKGMTVRVQGLHQSGNDNLVVDPSSVVSIEVEFINQPESNL